MKLKICVIPRSSKNCLTQMPDGTLKLKLTAPAIEGKANDCLVKFLSNHFHLPRYKIKIAKGMASRNKIIEIDND